MSDSLETLLTKPGGLSALYDLTDKLINSMQEEGMHTVDIAMIGILTSIKVMSQAPLQKNLQSTATEDNIKEILRMEALRRRAFIKGLFEKLLAGTHEDGAKNPITGLLCMCAGCDNKHSELSLKILAEHLNRNKDQSKN